MNQNLAVELIRVSPNLTALVVIGILVYRYKEPLANLLDAATRKGSQIKIFGLELTLITGEVERATKKQGAPYNPAQSTILAARINSFQRSPAYVHAIWIDDNPDQNFHERTALASLGVLVDTVIDSNAALKLIKSGRFDFVLSDIERQQSSSEGIRFLNYLVEEEKISLPCVFYVGRCQHKLGTPAYAFGITDSPTELLHLVLDILQRQPPR